MHEKANDRGHGNLLAAVAGLGLALLGAPPAGACDLEATFIAPTQTRLPGSKAFDLRVRFKNVGRAPCAANQVTMRRNTGSSPRGGRAPAIGGRNAKQQLRELAPGKSQDIRFRDEGPPISGVFTYDLQYANTQIDGNPRNHQPTRTVTFQAPVAKTTTRPATSTRGGQSTAPSKTSRSVPSGPATARSIGKTAPGTGGPSTPSSARSLPSAGRSSPAVPSTPGTGRSSPITPSVPGAGRGSAIAQATPGAAARSVAQGSCALVARFAGPAGSSLPGGQAVEWIVELRNEGRGPCKASTVSLERYTGTRQTGASSTVGGSGGRQRVGELAPGATQTLRVRERTTPESGTFTYALKYMPVINDGNVEDHQISRLVTFGGGAAASRLSRTVPKAGARSGAATPGTPTPSATGPAIQKGAISRAPTTRELAGKGREVPGTPGNVPDALRDRSVAPDLGRLAGARGSRMGALDAIVLLRFQNESPPAQVTMNTGTRPCFRWILDRSVPTGTGFDPENPSPSTTSDIQTEARLRVTELTIPAAGAQPLDLGWELNGGPREIRVHTDGGVLKHVSGNRMVIPNLCVKEAHQRPTGNYKIRLTVEDGDLGRTFDREVTVRVKTPLNPIGRPASSGGGDTGGGTSPPPPPPSTAPTNPATEIASFTVPNVTAGSQGVGTVTLDGRLETGMEVRICRNVGTTAVQIDGCPYTDVGDRLIAQGPLDGPSFNFSFQTDTISGSNPMPVQLVATLRQGSTNLEQQNQTFYLQPQGATPPPSPQATPFSSQLRGRFVNAKCVNCHAIPDRGGAYSTHMTGTERRWSGLPANPSSSQLMAYVTNPQNCTEANCHPVGGSPWSGFTFPSIWQSPPASMAWSSGASASSLCNQAKQHKSTAAAMYQHLYTNDPLVEWAIRKMGIGFDSTWKNEVEAWVGSPEGGWLDMPCE